MQRNVIENELQFKMVRASGAGGQHVNKVSTKVLLYFNVFDSHGLTEEQKERIGINLHTRLTNNGQLQLACGDTRSQLRNKRLVIGRLFELLELALVVQKERKKTKPSKSVKRKRLDNKRHQSQKKANRKPPEI